MPVTTREPSSRMGNGVPLTAEDLTRPDYVMSRPVTPPARVGTSARTGGLAA
jgi:hypothetical protein